MEHAHSPRGADCKSLTRRYSGSLLLSVIAGLLIACGGAGSSGSSAIPLPPNAAMLTWNPPVTTTNLSGYRVYFGTAPGTYLQPLGQGISVGNVTAYTLTGLASASTYYFAVTAFDTLGMESPYSNEVFKTIP